MLEGIKRCPVIYRAPFARYKQDESEVYLVNPSYEELVETYAQVRETQDKLNCYCTLEVMNSLKERSLVDFMSGNWERKSK
jgi:hypothetical protein